jgi:hypothetical protein
MKEKNQIQTGSEEAGKSSLHTPARDARPRSGSAIDSDRLRRWAAQTTRDFRGDAYRERAFKTVLATMEVFGCAGWRVRQ